MCNYTGQTKQGSLGNPGFDTVFCSLSKWDEARIVVLNAADKRASQLPDEKVKNITLITGGARSGKSTLAERLGVQSNLPVHYLATMTAIDDDAEQTARIERHRSRRPASWKTIEANFDLAQQIRALPAGRGLVIVDCLSLFVSNLMLGPNLSRLNEQVSPYAHDAEIEAAVDELSEAILSRADKKWVIVTNEVGWDVVPETALGRAFRDFLGISNQKFARIADEVYLMCCGIPLKIKPQG